MSRIRLMQQPLFFYTRLRPFARAEAFLCMKKAAAHDLCATAPLFQHRKRYGLHAIKLLEARYVEGQAFQYRKRYGLHAIKTGCHYRRSIRKFQYRKRYGLHAMSMIKFLGSVRLSGSFNTASGMDCMQYRPSQPLGQLNPEAGFLNGSLFLANRRNPAGFFCRQNRLKTSANPVISRKLLSTGKI